MSARRPWAWPLVPVYRVGLWVKDRLRAAGVLQAKRLGWPVVSVGSLSAGGAGKTPVVMALAEMLKERGWVVDVLSRGYGRTGRGVERVAVGSVDAARRYGDEPVVMAERLGVEVWVGSERYAAGERAERSGGVEESGRALSHAMPHPLADDVEGWSRQGGWSIDQREGAGARFASGKQVPRFARNDRKKGKGNDQGNGKGNDQGKGNGNGNEDNVGGVDDGSGSTLSVHVLDDGFQHRGLGRAVDVVLVTAEDLKDELLPAGNLREPLMALRRADVVVVRVEEMDAVGPRIEALVREGTLVWSVRRKLRFPAPLFVFGAGLKPVAFCAIARPEGFAAMLVAAGCGIAETVFFGDHHVYSMGDVERVMEVAKGLKATGLVTTEKDAVKLTAEMREMLEEVGPLMVVALEAELLFPNRVMRELEARLVVASARGGAGGAA